MLDSAAVLTPMEMVETVDIVLYCFNKNLVSTTHNDARRTKSVPDNQRLHHMGEFSLTP